MTSKEAQDKIQSLENQQSVLEKDLRDHKTNILALKREFCVTEGINTEREPELKKVKRSDDKTAPLPEKIVISDHSLEQAPVEPVSNLVIETEPKKKLDSETPRKPVRSLRSMEQDFGKVWFVRLGIISLLTGLVFLSNFAYTHFIVEWSAAPRLAGLYCLAFILLGLGTYFEKSKAALSNYGKVIAAGGMATLYYASYAAYHVDRLKVIDSPLIGGLLLTLSAGVCLAYALWKKSNITALCSIALAYYSTSINPVGAFSLMSGLLLTLAGLILLHRLRSASIGFVAMLGAYLSFIYWQLLVNDGSTGYAYSSWFIAGYWILSTASFLIPRSVGAHPFSKSQLLTFASLNNAFFVLLMSVNFQTHQWADPLWPVSAILGMVFIGLSAFLQYGEKLTCNVSHIPFRSSLSSLFLLKGIALITMALCLKLTGPSLALSLTIHAGLILISACRATGMRRNALTAAYLFALILGSLIYFNAISQSDFNHHLTDLMMAMLYLSISMIAHLDVSSADGSKPVQRGLPALLSIVAISAAVFSAEVATFTAINIFLALHILCALYQYFSNKKYFIPEVSFGSHVFTAIGCILFLQNLSNYSPQQFFIVTMMLFIATAINLCVFIKFGSPHKQYMGYLIVATISLILSFIATESVPVLLLLGSLIPISYHGFYQVFIRYKLRFIAVLGFTVYPFIWLACLVTYVAPFCSPQMLLHLIVAFIPFAHVLLIQQGKLENFRSIKPTLLVANAVLFAIWQMTYIGPWELTLAITACIYHLLDQNETKLFTGIASVFYAFSLLHATFVSRSNQSIIDLIALLPLGVYCCRKWMLERGVTTPSDYYHSTQRTIAIIASLTLWGISSVHLIRFYDTSALSIVWAVVGLIVLSLGFINRDIVFRTMAFIILGCTVLHVYGVDVWKLNALLRIISFITLGIVLLITGYLYCRKVDQGEESRD